MSIIKKITAAETVEVRHPILRKGKSVESCRFEGDDLVTTLHFGLYENDKLEGVISLFESRNPLFDAENQRQIRGMAVMENNQGKGFGKLLVLHCEKLLQQNGTTLIWFNARENAVGFYQKMGYEIIGNPFEIKDIGLHYVMWKNLNR